MGFDRAKPMRSYIVGLGSNVDPHQNMAAALRLLLSRFERLEVSRVIETAPVGPMKGTFLNAVVLLRSNMPATALKAYFCNIERELGRDRSCPDRALRSRTIDLDILLELSSTFDLIEASSISSEPYYRQILLDLIHTLGLPCPVTAEPVAGATLIMLDGGTIGLAPTSLSFGQHGSLDVASRRAALVTGGAIRVGREIVKTLAQAGYDIALHYHGSEDAAACTANECRALGVRCELLCADFRNADCLPGLVDAAAACFPHLELLVNSASVYESGQIADTTPELLDRQWDVNFKAPFLLMREFYRRLERGTIVNVLDNKIAFNQYRYAAYLTAKKALAEATKMAALEFAPRFRVNGIAPGVILPAAARDTTYLEWRRAGIPVGRLGDPAQLCQALKVLISNDFINGQILFVDGGESTNFVGRNAPDFTEVRREARASAMEFNCGCRADGNESVHGTLSCKVPHLGRISQVTDHSIKHSRLL